MVVLFLFIDFVCCCFSTFVCVGGFGIGAFGKEELADGLLCIGDEIDPPGVVGGVGAL